MEFVLAGIGGVIGAFLTGLGFILYMLIFKPLDKIVEELSELKEKVITNENDIKNYDKATTRIEGTISEAMKEIKEMYKETLSENDVKNIATNVGEKHKVSCHAEMKNLIYKAVAQHEDKKH